MNEFSGKLGSYENGLRAFLKVFWDKFPEFKWETSEDAESLRGHHFVNLVEKENVIVTIRWILDEGGLFLTADSPFFNSRSYACLCNRPKNPYLANNYVRSARQRRQKPKYKHEACKIAKQIRCNWLKNAVPS